MSIDQRVGILEQEQVRQGERLFRMEKDLSKTVAGVDRLLERDMTRPAMMTPQSLALASGGIASIGAVVWWLIGTSPAVQDLDRRMSRLDDPEIGRVSRIERELWRTTVSKSK